MHASSLWNIRVCLATYGVDRLAGIERPRVLDVGSSDVNGSYRNLFAARDVDYIGADLNEGRGVDVLLSDPYKLPFEAASMDLVLCGQMLEHCEFPWLSIREMMRVLKPEGLLFLIAPSSGPIHQYPVDCYRFYPDAYRALAKDAGCHLIDVWLDDKGPWNDLVGVLAHETCSAREHKCELPWEVALEAWRPPPSPGPTEEEVTAGEIHYLDTLKQIQDTLRPGLYLEIGVRHGRSLALAAERAIGVDPSPEIDRPLSETTLVVSRTSDAFFHDHATLLTGGVDLAFIDGMHWAEFAFRDFVSVEKHSNPWSMVAIDDVFPGHAAQASRVRHTQVWTGDVWRLVECLRSERPDLLIVPLSTRPTGMVLIVGLDAANQRLRERYNPLHSQLSRAHEGPIPASILTRVGAYRPDDPSVLALLKILADLQQHRASTRATRRELKRWQRETKA